MRFGVMVALAIVFFVVLILFRGRINKHVKGDEGYFDEMFPLRKVSRIIHKKNETRCREVFERTLGRSFPNIRPSFMKRKSNGALLELDGYNRDLALAFEYNGQQHYHFTPRFHKNVNQFYSQLERDKEKEAMCAENGVTLITIPYTVKYDDLEDYIKKKLRGLGFTETASL